MKKMNVITGLAIMLTVGILVGCTKENIEKVMPEFVSYPYFSFGLEERITAPDMELNSFNAQGAYQKDGKIFVSNFNNNRLEIVDAATNKYKGYIKSWTVNSAVDSLKQPTDVCVAGGKIYVSCKSTHMVHVFDASSYAYLASIGIGTWSPENGANTIMDPQAVRVAGDKVFVKTRQEYIHVFYAPDVKAANYKKVLVRAFLKIKNYNSANSTYAMEVVGDSLYVTDRYNAQIHVYNIAKLVVNDKVTGDRAKAVEPVLTIDLPDKTATPSGLSIYKNKLMLVSYANKSRIDLFVKDQNTLVSSFTSVGNYSFKTPEKLFVSGDKILVSDPGNGSFSILSIKESTIKEFK